MKNHNKILPVIFLITVLFTASCFQGKKKLVKPAAKNPRSVTEMDGKTPIAEQSYQLQIHQNERVGSLQIPQAAYDAWKRKDEFNKPTQVKPLVQYLYSQFEDQFDFIFLILNEDKTPSDLPSGVITRVSNSVEGIGEWLPSNGGESYQFAKQLKSILTLGRRDGMTHGPSLHELMHTWGNFIIPTEYPGHWGCMGGSEPGQLGGFKESTLKSSDSNQYSADAFGINANGGNAVPYSELELYLMGMIPIEEVKPFTVFRNVTDMKQSYDLNTSTFKATERLEYNQANILKDAGKPRNPSNQHAQKSFRLLAVVLTPKPLTEAEWKSVDKSAERFGKAGIDDDDSFNFWEATGHRGTMKLDNLKAALRK